MGQQRISKSYMAENNCKRGIEAPKLLVRVTLNSEEGGGAIERGMFAALS